jgi:hypothetical protein
MLQNGHLRLPPFHFDADPDPAFHSDADPDPALAFHFDTDPNADLDPASQMMQIHCGAGSETLLTGVRLKNTAFHKYLQILLKISEPGETRRLYGRWSWPLQQPEQQGGIHFTQIPPQSH